MRQHQNRLLPEEEASPPTWVHSPQRSAQWWQTSPPTKPDGTTVGKNFSDCAEKGRAILDRLILLVDEDTEAFNRIMAVFAMPKNTPEEKRHVPPPLRQPLSTPPKCRSAQ